MSAATAKRVALAAQGFGVPRPDRRIDRRHGRRVLDHVGVIQIDSVNVLCRSQELPLFARLGPHDRNLVERMTGAGEIFEYWAHEASHVPVALHPALRWRMADARNGSGTWRGVARIAVDAPELVASALAQVEERKLTVAMLRGGGSRRDGMWGWSPGKAALEYLFWSGQITARRGPNFERWYDLPERSLPPAVLALPTPSRREAHKDLIELAARSHGVGTARDLIDYFRLKNVDRSDLLDDLAGEGRLLPVEVEGWKQPAWMHPRARVPRRISGRALLSPFDSLVWERNRVERMWGFRYRIEIYVPKHKRVHGYYVLPFLLDGELVARVDLKSDRRAKTLLVQAAWGEDGIEVDHVCTELAAELVLLAGHLGLTEGVEVVGPGDLAADLSRAIAARG